MKYNPDKIRALNPLSVQLEFYGIEVNKKGFARCPFHNERTASFKVYPDNTFHCFGCGAHGDVIAFVMLIEKLDFGEACARLDGDISYSQQRKIERGIRNRRKKTDRREEARRGYWNMFDLWKANEDIIKAHKPQSSEDIPDEKFLKALNIRFLLEYELEQAETFYRKGE